MRQLRSYVVTILMTGVFGAIVLTCADPAGKRSPERRVAEKYCSGCHRFPEPDLLAKKTWLKSVLPVMGPRLGIYRYLDEKYPSPGRGIIATPEGTYPEKPLLTVEEWETILAYYSRNAPDSLPVPSRRVPQDTAALFAARFPESIVTEPATLGLFIDSAARQLLVANAAAGAIEFYNADLVLRNEVAMRRPVVHIERTQPAGYLLTDIGNYFPSDFKEGAAWTLSGDPGLGGVPAADRDDTTESAGPSAKRFIPMLGRPVQIRPTDLDTNGRTDYLICAYGLFDGELAWYPSPDKKYVLRKAPGALQAEVSDVNGDGRPDVWALFAQGDESLYLFTNRGGSGFEEKRLLRFPPSYGSSSFDIRDFNRDGYPDILYTCGDNADFSVILKPYHGVYIYLNDGKGNFEKAWFYPVNGAYKAVSRDFDLDGDPDIVSIAYFPDLERSAGEALLYFENGGDMEFTPRWVRGAGAGRWINMQAGDLDGDGDTDIALGSFTASRDQIIEQYPGKWRNAAPFLLLENTTY